MANQEDDTVLRESNLMAVNRPSILIGGLRLLLANKRLLLWSYLALLAAGLVGGASLHARIAPFLDHSLAAEKLAGSVDVAYYAELFQHANQHNPGNGPVTAALTLVSVLFSFFLAAGALFVFLSGEKPRLGTVFRAGIEYFWRFFRLMLFFLLISGVVLGPLGGLRSVYLKHADEKYVEAAYDWRAVLTLVVILLIAVVLRLWFDLAEAYVVQLGREGDRRVRRSLGPSLRLLRTKFWPVFASYFAVGTFGVVVFLLFAALWAVSQSSHQVLLVFLLSQVGVLGLAASRIWQRGIAASLVLAHGEQTQTVILVEPARQPDFLSEDAGLVHDNGEPLPSADPLGTADPLEGPAV